MENHININSIPTKLKRYVDFTINAAFDHDPGNGTMREKIAALILYKNKPISIGFNSLKTHTLQNKYKKNDEAICLHAEIDCLRKALNHLSVDDFNKTTMIVMRSKRDGEWGMAKPCIGDSGCGCQSAIRAFGIGKVYYSTDETGILGIF